MLLLMLSFEALLPPKLAMAKHMASNDTNMAQRVRKGSLP
jgi:hypothetical protein